MTSLQSPDLRKGMSDSALALSAPLASRAITAAPPTTARPLTGARRMVAALFGNRTPRLVDVQIILAQGQKLAVSMFLEGPDAVRSLGITSPISGEGKTLLAASTAVALSRASSTPTTIVECNWQHPTLHELFDIPSSPGLAEWLRAESDQESVQYHVCDNLVVIPAGDARQGELLLLERLRAERLQALTGDDRFLVVDLPPMLSTTYSPLAASMVDALIVVARAAVTPTDAIAETCAELRAFPVRGVVLNQVTHRIPAWLDRIL